MNTATRDALDAIPIPFEDGYPVRAMAIQRSGAWRTAWGMDGCRRPEPFGEVYPSAAEAARAARHLNERGGA
jgi:hypothetical protein